MRFAHKIIPGLSTEISTDVATPAKIRPLLKPIEHTNVSPYLQQPLRTMDQVRAEREQRQRELAEAMAKRLANDTTADAAVVAPARVTRAG